MGESILGVAVGTGAGRLDLEENRIQKQRSIIQNISLSLSFYLYFRESELYLRRFGQKI